MVLRGAFGVGVALHRFPQGGDAHVPRGKEGEWGVRLHSPPARSVEGRGVLYTRNSRKPGGNSALLSFTSVAAFHLKPIALHTTKRLGPLEHAVDAGFDVDAEGAEDFQGVFRVL